MDLKIKEAITWGRVVAILGFISSGLTMLTFIGIPVGVLMLLGFVKLNNATDELKAISQKGGNRTAEDYEEVISLYGKCYKMIGIGAIVSVIMSIIGMILYALFFVFLFASFNGYTSY